MALPEKDPSTGKFVKADTSATATVEVDPAEQKKDAKKEPVDTKESRAFMDRYLTRDKKPEAKEAKAETDADAEKKKKDAANAEAAKKKKEQEKTTAKPNKSPAQATVPDYDKIAEAAGRGVADALSKKADAKTDKKDGVDESVSPEDKRKLDVLAQMEKMWPEKYKGHSEKYKASKQLLVDYAEKWQKDHPGDSFDEEAEEHQDFFDKHDVDWHDDDYAEALAELKADAKVSKALEEKEKRINERLSEFDRREKLRDSGPVIAKEQNSAAKHFWGLLGDDFGDIVGDDGAVNAKKLTELEKSDPVIHEIRLAAAEQLDSLVATTYTILNGLTPFDEKNATHLSLSEFIFRKEEELAAKPEEERLDAQGRKFLKADAYAKLPKDKREGNWSFTTPDIAALLASHIAEKTAARITAEEEKLQKFATARGYAPKDGKTQDVKEKPEQVEEEPDTDDGKPKSPSTIPTPKLAATKSKGGSGGADAKTSFVNRYLRKT